MSQEKKNDDKEILFDEEEQEDLGVKIGSKEEVFWTDAKRRIDEDIFQAERVIQMNKHLLILIEERIAEEQKV
tara:strand:- start:1465 stop:1683 length:219 start_codon:yes stop_codon:yes gene_type:complete